jgi:hypothetical protein
MNISTLSNSQRVLAVHRLTALWAFAESGLGGVLHALKVPFTGLVVGGLAVILITFIGYFSNMRYKQILQSLIVVLIVKAVVSPHTPFPAYIAVSFQAVIGFLLFTMIQINFLSILLLSVLAMLESAIQKLLILTFFFGKSIWNAADELGNFIARQFSFTSLEGSYWLAGLYLFVYLAGGVVIAGIAFKMIRKLSDPTIVSHFKSAHSYSFYKKNISNKKLSNKKLFPILFLLIIISLLLYIFSDNNQQASFEIIVALTWTITAITLWYIFFNPLITKLILFALQKNESRYSQQINETLSFLPVLKELTAIAWKKSAEAKINNRLFYFLFLLINWSLTYTDSVQPFQK